MKKVFSVLNTITLTSGGLTNVCLTRAGAFKSRGINSYVVTTDYISKLNVLIREMRRLGRLSDSLDVLNLYTYFAYENVNKNTLTERNLFSEKNTVVRFENKDSLKDCFIYTYLDCMGKVFLTEIYDKNRIMKWGVLTLQGIEPFIFFSAKQLHAHFLSCITKEAVDTVIICDQPICCDAVLSVSHPHVFKVLTIHSNHYRPPYQQGNNVNDRYGNILSGMPYADSIVILTKRQKEHILDYYKDRGNLFVIGNPLSKNISDRKEYNIIDKNKCVAVCRLVPAKNLMEMIDVFIMAHEKNNNLTLDIWGEGVLKESLQDYINVNGANNFIRLRGYTNDPGKVFSEASMSLATSIFEGFGVTFAESLSVGTPVISYKTLYGPEEIISDGLDGYLVDDIHSFADKIVTIAENDKLRQFMGENGRRNMRRFSSESITDSWFEMFSCIQKRGAVNSLSHKDSISFADVSYNVTGSAYGWVYLSKEEVEKKRYNLSLQSNVQVIKVYSSKGFKGERNTLLEGDYQIDLLEYLPERNDYRFKLKKGSAIYEGPLGMKSIKLRIKD